MQYVKNLGKQIITPAIGAVAGYFIGSNSKKSEINDNLKDNFYSIGDKDAKTGFVPATIDTDGKVTSLNKTPIFGYSGTTPFFKHGKEKIEGYGSYYDKYDGGANLILRIFIDGKSHLLLVKKHNEVQHCYGGYNNRFDFVKYGDEKQSLRRGDECERMSTSHLPRTSFVGTVDEMQQNALMEEMKEEIGQTPDLSELNNVDVFHPVTFLPNGSINLDHLMTGDAEAQIVTNQNGESVLKTKIFKEDIIVKKGDDEIYYIEGHDDVKNGCIVPSHKIEEFLSPVEKCPVLTNFLCLSRFRTEEESLSKVCDKIYGKPEKKQIPKLEISNVNNVKSF